MQQLKIFSSRDSQTCESLAQRFIKDNNINVLHLATTNTQNSYSYFTITIVYNDVLDKDKL